MEQRNEERFKEFFNTSLQQSASENCAFYENDANFSQSIEINTVRIKKEVLDSVFVEEDSLLETKIEIEEHGLYHNATHLFDKETFYSSKNNNVQKDLNTTRKSVINLKDFKNFFNDGLKQSIKKESSLTVSSDYDGYCSESIDSKLAFEDNINSKNLHEKDILGEASLNEADNESNLSEIFGEEGSKQLKSESNKPEKSTRCCRNNAGGPKLFCCDVCPFKSSTKYQLVVHIAENHEEVAKVKKIMETQYMLPGSSSGEILFKCNQCFFVTKSKYSLRRHLLTHKSMDECEQIFRCASCPFIAKSKSLISSHMIVHIPAERHKCPHCDFQTKHENYVRSHIKKMHNPEKMKQKELLNSRWLVHKTPDGVVMYKCKLCPFSTKHRKSIIYHRTTHMEVSKEDMLPCTLCPYKAKLKKTLRQHMLIHKTPNEVIMYKCNLCPFSTKRNKNLTQHQTVHMEVSKEDMIPCSLCPYKGKSNKLLKQHMFTHKTPDEVIMHKCDFCPFSTRRKSNLTQHQTAHMASEENMILCNLCTFKAKNQKRLSNHMRTHLDPSQITIYKCDQCTYQSQSSTHIESHALVRKNKDKMPTFQCDHCEYKATVKHYIRTHYRLMHMGPSEIDWKLCEKCGFKTKLLSNLKKHSIMHNKPEELEMFLCAQCPFSTKTKQELKKHVGIHMNVYYNCPTCSFKTKKRSSLNYHKIKVHQRKLQT